MKVQVREDKVIIDGYVNAVERFSKPLYDKKGKFIERIMPTVFNRALEKNSSVKVLLDHDYDRELANTKDSNAQLYEDNIGLRALVEISDAEVIEKAKKKLLKGWSFGFVCNKDEEIVNKDGIRERSVRDIDLIEISILDDKKIPAYVGTSIEVRDDIPMVIEIRSEEFDANSFSYEEEPAKEETNNFDSMTASQKREVLNSSFRQLFPDGWLEDYDEFYVYGTTKEDSTLYKIPYVISGSEVNIDSSKQVKVVRGGYKEVRSDEVPEQQPDKEVVKIDYSNYEERLKKIKEEK